MSAWIIAVAAIYCVAGELIKNQPDLIARSFNISHETDCSLFYLFRNGKAILKECSSHLHLNRRNSVCDYPKYVDCIKEIGDIVYTEGRISDKTTHFTCPIEDNPRYQVLYPHPTDCSKYYSCSNGVAHVRFCSTGLHFISLLQKCEYPENAECDKEVVDEPKGKTGRETRIDECPASNSIVPKLLPHATDCNKFYICDAGKPHLKSCQPGLHFSRKIQVCDYPDKAGCDTTSVTGTSEDVEEKENTKKICPLKTTGHPVLLPHSSDCEKFYICSAGIPHLKSCQHGLHFNVKLQICDYPSNAGCDSNFVQKPREKKIDDEVMGCSTDPFAEIRFIVDPHDCSKFFVCHHGRTHPQSCPSGLHFNVNIKACDYPENAKCSERKSSDINPQNGPGVPSPFCPPVNGKSLVFYLHPSNCSVYYMCNHGLAFEFTCPSGLHFNLQKKVCDYEWLAGCEKDD